MTKEEAMERIKVRFDKWALDNEDTEAIQTLIPELTESEDERTIKKLQEYVKNRNWTLSGPTQSEVLAWLEKQKDASKAIEAVDRIDKYIDEHVANAHDMKDSNPDKKYYRGWDDALGKMAGILQDVYSGEKQKEQRNYRKLYEDIAKSEWFKKTYEGKSLGGDDEQKPAEWDDYTKTNLDRAIQIIKRAKGKLQGYQTDDGIYECDKAIEALEHFLYRGLEIEKSAEWDKLQADFRNINEAFEDGKKEVVAHPEKYGLCRPTEWSEEDNEVLQQVIADIEDLIAAETSPGFLAKYNKHLDWLKLLPERFYLTPKQEWSEVELEFRGEKVKVKRPFFRDDKGHEYSTAEQDEDVAWYAFRAWCEKKGVSLYDLYPRQDEDVAWYAFRAWCEKKGVSLYDLYPREEWSEEDEKILNELLDHCNTENATWYNWLKSLRPQPHTVSIKDATKFGNLEYERGVKDGIQSEKSRHWKPSEEQMEALKRASTNEYLSAKQFDILVSLYEQLKKL